MSAPLIRCDVPGSFARDVFHARHPVLVGRILAALPWAPAQQAAFHALLTESQQGVVPGDLPMPGPDADAWAGEWSEHAAGSPWPRLQFLWAESYFYRRLLHASGYFADGGGRGVDLFAPFKDAELAGPDVDAELAGLDRARDLPADDRERVLLHAALWGNQADLGFTITAEAKSPEGLVADDSAALWPLLDGGRVVVVADNSGRELLADLALVDHLLDSGRAGSLDLLVKPQPYFVSDATPTDVLACLRRMPDASRLEAALRDGRLRMLTHLFACAPLPYAAMPADLRDFFADAQVTVMKGDLNYRRLVDDRYWPASASFGDVTGYFPGPVAALRTVKSEVVVGLDADVAADLDAKDPEWRISGTHAVIQVRV